MEIRTVLVEPKNEENIGAVARVLKNFGLTDLVLVNPPPLRAKAFSVASHAADLLGACTIVPTLAEAIGNAALVVGATSQSGVSSARHLRRPFFTPCELKAKLQDHQGVLALLFGREDTGLLNEELMRCDPGLSRAEPLARRRDRPLRAERARGYRRNNHARTA
jgi:TrmH family RNA methyltransferase